VRPGGAEEVVEMLADETVQHAVLGVPRAIHGLGGGQPRSTAHGGIYPCPKMDTVVMASTYEATEGWGLCVR
jgi:hypothetical protein